MSRETIRVAEASRESERFAPVTQGERLSSIVVGGVRVLRTRHVAEARLPRHAHERASIVFVTSGEFVETVGTTEYWMEPGSVLLKPAGVLHADRFGARGAESMVVVLPMVGEDDRLWGSPAVRTPKHFTSGPVTHLATRIHRELRGSDELTPLVVSGLVRELVGIATREDGHGRHSAPPWMRHVRERIEDEFTESLTVRELAEEAGVHPDYLSRRFKSDYGVVIGEYVRRLRVDRAAESLRSTDRPIDEIARATGFVDQSHLTKVFKRYVGMTPGRFRDRTGRDDSSTPTRAPAREFERSEPETNERVTALAARTS